MDWTNFTLLLAAGIPWGIFCVVIGGGMFLSIPFFQILFPEISLAAIVGNSQMGSMWRGFASTWSTRKHIVWKEALMIAIFPMLATILGVALISQLDQRWVLPALFLAIAVAEGAPYLVKYITDKKFVLVNFLAGVYAGVLGAGISVILVALLRLKHPNDEDIAQIKIQARFVELLLVFSVIIGHFYYGNMIMDIWLPWAIGALIGGWVGGKMLIRIGTFSGKWQKAIMRASFVMAVIIAAVKFF